MRKGFTLIELLVVIAIIAILAAILFPVFAKARQAAKVTKCLAHGRQLGTACLAYMDDNNGRFPSKPPQSVIDRLPHWDYNWLGTGNKTWSSVEAFWRYYTLRPYVRSDDIWICPDPHTNYAKRYAYGYHISWCPRSEDSTWGNATAVGFVDGDRGFWTEVRSGNEILGIGRTIPEVMALDMSGRTICGRRYVPPSKKIMWMCYALGEWGNNSVGSPPGAWPWIYPSYAHNNGSTYVYADGHSAWRAMGRGWAPIGYTNVDVDKAPTIKL